MSDGISEARRAGDRARELAHAAQRLAWTLEEAQDAIFEGGFMPGALDLVNEQLKSIGVRLVLIQDKT